MLEGPSKSTSRVWTDRRVTAHQGAVSVVAVSSDTTGTDAML